MIAYAKRPYLPPSASANYPGAAQIFFATKPPTGPNTHLVLEAAKHVQRAFPDDDDILIYHKTFAPRFVMLMDNLVLAKYLECLFDTMFYYRQHPDRFLTDDHSQHEFAVLFTDPAPSLDVAFLTMFVYLAAKGGLDAVG